jgi:hypothetical protein
LKRQRPWVYTGQDGATGEEVGRRLEEAILKYEHGEEDRIFPIFDLVPFSETSSIFPGRHTERVVPNYTDLNRIATMEGRFGQFRKIRDITLEFLRKRKKALYNKWIKFTTSSLNYYKTPQISGEPDPSMLRPLHCPIDPNRIYFNTQADRRCEPKWEPVEYEIREDVTDFVTEQETDGPMVKQSDKEQYDEEDLEEIVGDGVVNPNVNRGGYRFIAKYYRNLEKEKIRTNEFQPKSSRRLEKMKVRIPRQPTPPLPPPQCIVQYRRNQSTMSRHLSL